MKTLLSIALTIITTTSSLHTITFYQPNTQRKKPKTTSPKAPLFHRVQIFQNFKFNTPRRIRKDKNGNFIISDIGDNRLVVFDQSMRFLRQIGQFGQGPNDLYSPGDFALDPQGRIYVIDHGNRRLQIFDPSGKRIGGFPLDTKATSIVINSKGHILLNQPHKGYIVSVYSQDGKLINRFGKLLTVSHAYPGRPNDEKSGIPISRANFALDEKDNLYVAYIFAPILQKYDPSGNLAWEVRLSGPEIDSLVKAFWEYPKAVASMNIDGVQMATICEDMAFDPNSRRVYIMLGNDNLYVADSSGRKIFVAREDAKGWGFTSLTISDGILYATSFDNRCFKLVFR